MTTTRSESVPSRPASPRAQRMRPRFVAHMIARGDRPALDRAFRLRHAVFVRELGWVPGTRRERESDRCDGAARHFGVFAVVPGSEPEACERASLAGYARVLLPEAGFMLHHEFAAVLAGAPDLPDPRRSFEVSRVVVQSELRGARDVNRRAAVDHLARAIASWARAQGRDQWLSVCELRHVRALRLRGFPCTRVGRVVEYQPGVPVCAVHVDLAQVAAALRVNRPRDYAWYCAEGRVDG